MSEIHGSLLIGGMTLRNLFGTLESEPKETAQSAKWWGELLIEPSQNEYLESGRPYRLELEDGRAGQVVVRCVECGPGQGRLRVRFDGLSSLQNPGSRSESGARRDDSF